MTRDPAREPAVVAERRIGDEIVLLTDTQHAIALSGEPAALYDLGGVSRRRVLQLAAAGAAVAGIAVVKAPSAFAAGSTPTAAITPITGPKGTVVSLTGSHLAPNKLIQVTVAGVSATISPAAVTTDSFGNIPAGVTFTIPDTGTLTGARPVAVIVNAVSTSAGNFTITLPALTLTPSTGPSGQVVTLSGTGFGPSSATLTAKFDTTARPITGSTGTSSGGAINGTPTITVPTNQTVANHTVTVTDSFGNVGTATYAVAAPSVTISPATLPHKGSPQVVAVSGSGFLPGSPLTFSAGTGFNSVTAGGSYAATSGGAIPAGATATVTYGNGNGTGFVVVTDGAGNTDTSNGASY